MQFHDAIRLRQAKLDVRSTSSIAPSGTLSVVVGSNFSTPVRINTRKVRVEWVAMILVDPWNVERNDSPVAPSSP